MEYQMVVLLCVIAVMLLFVLHKFFIEWSVQRIEDRVIQILGVRLHEDEEEAEDDDEEDNIILFHKIHPDAVLPERHGACYDLAVPEDITIPAGETVKIHLGFSAKLPEYTHAKIYMRSSTWGKFGIMLSNHVGIIDNSYCGDNDEWILSVYRKRSAETDIVIPKGTRIAQFELCDDSIDYEFQVVDTLNSEDRGGFGSTGD